MNDDYLCTSSHQLSYLGSCIIQDPKKTGHRGFGFVTFAEEGVADRVSRRTHEIHGQEVLSEVFLLSHEAKLIPLVSAFGIIMHSILFTCFLLWYIYRTFRKKKIGV